MNLPMSFSVVISRSSRKEKHKGPYTSNSTMYGVHAQLWKHENVSGNHMPACTA